MTTPCDETAPPELAQALAQFDAGDYFRCHETLEVLWQAEARAVRDVYKGVLMLAVGLHHDARGKRKGSLRPLERAKELLTPFVPACLGLDVASILAACTMLSAHMENAPEDQPVPPELVPKLGPMLRL